MTQSPICFTVTCALWASLGSWRFGFFPAAFGCVSTILNSQTKKEQNRKSLTTPLLNSTFTTYYLIFDGFPTASMRNWAQVTSPKFSLKNALRSGHIHICQQTSQELKVRTRLAQTLWTKTTEFHLSLFMTPVLQLNSLVIPYIMQKERYWSITMHCFMFDHMETFPFLPCKLNKSIFGNVKLRSK